MAQNKQCDYCLVAYPVSHLIIRGSGRVTDLRIKYICDKCRNNEIEPEPLPDPDEQRKYKTVKTARK